MTAPGKQDAQTPSRETLLAAVDRFPAAHVLVIGDAILDHYVHGTVSRVSAEAPVPVVAVQEERYVLGGAANVVANAAALGGKVSLVSVCGRDAEGRTLRTMLRRLRPVHLELAVANSRRTSVKTRLVAHRQQMVRIDRERTDPIDTVLRGTLIEAVRAVIREADAVIVEDYGKGTISAELVAEVRELAHRQRPSVPVMVDPKTEDALMYKRVDLITPNTNELREMSAMPVRNEAELAAAAERLRRRLQCRAVLVTRGPEGMTLFRPGGEAPVTIPTAAREVYDVSGAGDTVVATVALATAAGMDLVAAAHLANQAAGLVVARYGVATVSADELRAALRAT